MDYQALANNIKQWSRDLGFDQVGITDVDLSAYEPHVHRWLASNFHGSMTYLTGNLDKRLHPEQLHPGTLRVICVRMNYKSRTPPPLESLADTERAYIAEYALGRDYHKVIRRRLAKLAQQIDAVVPGHCRPFTDSAPVLEKALGEKAGLGWIGKHSLLLNQQAGSWFFLGELFTDLPLPIDAPEQENHCGNCSACITVCPTDAIIAPQQLDARKCISYLTIENKGTIDLTLRKAMGNRVFGCDDCQLYCPWNRFAQLTNETDFSPRHSLDNTELLTLFAWREADFLKNTEGSAMRRISYAQWVRNLAVGLGNMHATSKEHRSVILEALARKRSEFLQLGSNTHLSSMVVEHIDWALQQHRASLPAE